MCIACVRARDEQTGIDDTVTGLAYCPATKTLWMASNSAQPLVYDPRSATDITPFLQQNDIPTSQSRDAKERIQRLFRIPQVAKGEEDWLVGTTSSRNVLIWRYNPHGACAILRGHTDWVEVLACAYKAKPPADGSDDGGAQDSMVVLSGGADSTIRRWAPHACVPPCTCPVHVHTCASALTCAARAWRVRAGGSPSRA